MVKITSGVGLVRGIIMSDYDSITITNASVGYSKDDPLIQGISLTLKPGDIVAINGVSGIGKTTLLKTLAGLVRPINGDITIFGNKRTKRGEVGYIPQRLGLIRNSTVHHNVILGAMAGHTKPWFPFSRDTKIHTKKAIEAMGIESKTRVPVGKLSGGQQRRVAIARTLAQEPKLILADEFLAELDEETLTKVMDVVLDYVKKKNAIMILVEHDLSRAEKMATRIFTAENGKLVEN